MVKSWASRQETYTDMLSPTCCDSATLPHQQNTCMWGWLKVLVQRNWWFKQATMKHRNSTLEKDCWRLRKNKFPRPLENGMSGSKCRAVTVMFSTSKLCHASQPMVPLLFKKVAQCPNGIKWHPFSGWTVSLSPCSPILARPFLLEIVRQGHDSTYPDPNGACMFSNHRLWWNHGNRAPWFETAPIRKWLV